MYRFFDAVTRPLLDAAEPAIVVEIGSDHGDQTELLAGWCADHGAILHCVDPLPKYDVDEWAARWPGTIEFHLELSLNALPEIGAVDFVCLDGDHNWYTVYHELEILERSALRAGEPFPITIMHDIGWPYGRRDLYYDPETIPAFFRHPYRSGGLSPHHKEPLKQGFNDHLANAIYEGTPRNGVLTAVEDFLEASELGPALHTFPGIHGLGVLADQATIDRMGETWDDLTGPAGHRRVAETVEADRVERLLEIAEFKRKLDLERDRVERLRDDLTDKSERLQATRAKRDEVRAERDDARAELEAAREELARTRVTLEDTRTELEDTRAEVESVREEAEEARRKARRSIDDARRSADERVREAQEQARTSEERRHEEVADRDEEIAALKHNLSKTRRDLTRLRNRRSVRAALKVAQLARPLFRLRRGQLGGRSRDERDGPTDQGDSSSDEGADAEGPSGTQSDRSNAVPTVDVDTHIGEGSFHAEVETVIEQGAPEDFLRAYGDSEEALREDHDRPLPSRPLVSVVMPTYNRAHVLGDAISSVLDQTYDQWELLVCDDGSEDDTEQVVRDFGDERIVYQPLEWGGAARARNAGLEASRGELIAYLDSDNLWHPLFLETMVRELATDTGQHLAYSKYIDLIMSRGDSRLKKYPSLEFDYDRLANKNFIDLNSIVHRRGLYEHLGGFNEELFRQQDWDLILRYTFLRNPRYVDRYLVLYRRSEEWGQLTRIHRDDDTSVQHIQSMVERYYREGVPSAHEGSHPSLTVLSWDVCRNHFSKAYNLAESLAGSTDVQLLGFRFFDEPIFPPYVDATPTFETEYMRGGDFPGWSRTLAKAVARARGDVLYAVKPRLPSLGVALLANFHFGKPIVLETNDLESVVTSPSADQEAQTIDLADVDPGDRQLLNPYGDLWTAIMEGLAARIPLRATHNSVLDEHFGGGGFLVRNPKDEQHFDPDRYDRLDVRRRLGFEDQDRVLLFGGMVRKHKGVFEFAELLDRAGPHFRLLVVGSRETPDQVRLRQQVGDRVTIVGPVDRNEMARVNHASDAVVLWLDPDVAASHYQMPFKLTDALAMEVPVIANEIGDLGDLGARGYLRNVPFGDIEGLAKALNEVVDRPPETVEMVERGRRLYLRQFSYAAVRRQLELILDRAMDTTGTLRVAEEFAEFFARFRDESGTLRPDVGASS